MPEARRGARRLHYDVAGDGPLVVLVPGIGSGGSLFGTLPRRFARAGFRCATPDPVGLPPSSPLDGPFSLAGAAADLWALADAEGAGDIHLVGTSLGGKVALEAAHARPERTRSLMMLASAVIPGARARSVHRMFEILAAELPPEHLAAATAPFLFGRTFHRRRATLIADIVRAHHPTAEARELMVAQATALRCYDGTAHAEELAMPVLCLAGAEDTLTDVEDVRATAALMARGECRVIEEAGHSLLLESAGVFDATVDFLRNVDAG